MKSWFNLTLIITRVLKKEQPSRAISGKHQREAARKTMQELVGLTSWGDVSQQDKHNPMRSQRLNSKILEHAEESIFAKGWFGFYLKCMCHQIIVVRGRMWLKNQKSGFLPTPNPIANHIALWSLCLLTCKMGRMKSDLSR